LLAGVVVPHAAGVAEQGVDGRVGLAGDVAEGVVGLVVGNRGRVGGVVVSGQIADGAQIIGQRPEDVFDAAVVDRFVGQQLVDGIAPEVAVGEIGGRVAVELENGLVAVVDPEGVGGRAGAIAVGIEFLMDQAVEGVVDVVDGLGGGAAVGGPVGDVGEAVAMVPGVLGDRGVARVEGAAGVGVDEAGGAVAVGVVGVGVDEVGCGADSLGVLNACYADLRSESRAIVPCTL